MPDFFFPFFNMFGGMVSSGINAGANAAAIQQQNAANLRIAKLNNKANFKLAQYQFDKNLDMWYRQNAYNTPAAQMQRFADAGLNPNLIYGQGSAGNASSAPSYQAPEFHGAYMNAPHFDFPNFVSMYFDAAQRAAQIDNLQASAKVANEEVQNKITLRALNRARLLSTNAGTAYLLGSMPYRIGNQRLQYEYNNRTLESRVKLPEYQANYLAERTRLAGQQIQYMSSQIDLNQVRSALMRSQIEFNKVKSDYQRQMNNFGYQNSMIMQHGKMFGLPVGAAAVGLDSMLNDVSTWFDKVKSKFKTNKLKNAVSLPYEPSFN